MRCNLCPRKCNVDRSVERGFCDMPWQAKISDAFLHYGEEPFISGKKGSGTVFFSGCNLKCVFCQNYEISQYQFGTFVTEEELAEIFLKLQSKGAHNINLVTPTIHAYSIKKALVLAKEKGLKIPVLYNTNAYENVETIKMLEGLIDIYLPDLKYYDDEIVVKYSEAPDYFKYATQAILEMERQVGVPEFDENGVIKKGLVIRHLVMPRYVEDTKKILLWIKENLPRGVYVSLMSQYTPYYKARNYPEINRRLHPKEYKEAVEFFFKIGLKNGIFQNL